jgi:drug/metabolite transporter (DMT)-like permease
MVKTTKNNLMKTFGMILIVIGIVMLIITGVSYTTEETVIDAGPLEVNAEKQESINWPPYAGGAALVAGIILVVASRKR